MPQPMVASTQGERQIPQLVTASEPGQSQMPQPEAADMERGTGQRVGALVGGLAALAEHASSVSS